MKRIFGLVLALAFSANTWAVPIVNHYAGVGSGTLNGEDFDDVSWSVTMTSDTSTRIPVGGDAFKVFNSAATITLAGLGTFDFITETFSFVNNGIGIAGFGRVGFGDLFHTDSDVQLETWDLTTSIGPFAGIGRLLQWAGPPFVSTTGGDLFFFSNTDVQSTFFATVNGDGGGGTTVPEPNALALLGVALLAFALIRRRADAR